MQFVYGPVGALPLKGLLKRPSVVPKGLRADEGYVVVLLNYLLVGVAWLGLHVGKLKFVLHELEDLIHIDGDIHAVAGILSGLVALAVALLVVFPDDVALLALAATNTAVAVAVDDVGDVYLGYCDDDFPILPPVAEDGSVLDVLLKFLPSYASVDILEVFVIRIYAAGNGSPRFFSRLPTHPLGRRWNLCTQARRLHSAHYNRTGL